MEQQDRLEKFIKDNRTDFDRQMPSFELWHKIETEIQGGATGKKLTSATSRRFGPRFFRVAASIAILIMAAGWGGYYLGQPSAAETSQELLVEIAPDFPELEQYYTEEIQEKYSRLVSLSYDATLEKDLDQVDQAMEELREELTHAPRENAAAIVSQMIQNYQIKVQILERVLERLEAGEQGAKDLNTKQNEVII